MDRVSGGMNTVSPPLPPASLFRFESRLLRCAQNDTGRSDGRSMRRPYLGFGIRAGTGACPYEDSVAGMGEGVSPYAPTFRAHTQVRPYGNWATTGDGCGLRAPLHLRVDEVLVFQLDATDRAGDRLSRRGREDFVLLQHSSADVVEVAAGIFFIEGIRDIRQDHTEAGYKNPERFCKPAFLGGSALLLERKTAILNARSD